MPCRVNRRRLWTARIVLEAGCHEFSSFVTLTYRDRYHMFCKVVPRELQPEHLQLFMKRLRRMYAPQPLRYYAVGEYGDRTWRPHYHLALFGVGIQEGPLVEKAWTHGHVHMGELNEVTAHYVAGYVTKKMTAPDDPRLRGLHPEFARMSLRPAIGKLAMAGIAKGLTNHGGSAALAELVDVPSEVRLVGKKYPLGRYLRSKLREEVGWGPGTPDEALIQTKVESALMPDTERWALERRRELTELSSAARTRISNSRKVL